MLLQTQLTQIFPSTHIAQIVSDVASTFEQNKQICQNSHWKIISIKIFFMKNVANFVCLVQMRMRHWADEED